MITNYKANQPFTSDFSVEKGEKNSNRTWNHGAGRIVNHVETFFTQKPENSVEGKPYSRNTMKANSLQTGQIFFPVPFKESRFPLFGISIQAGKRSSRSITERSCATGIDYFHKAQASNFQRRPWSPLCSKSAWSECSRKFCKFAMVSHHSLLRKERPRKPTRDETRRPLAQNNNNRLKYFISSERETKNQSTFKCYRFYTFCVSQM